MGKFLRLGGCCWYANVLAFAVNNYRTTQQGIDQEDHQRMLNG